MGPNRQAGPDQTVTRRIDREVAALAASQHGLVRLEQLVGLGLARSSVYERLAAGRLHVVKPAVFAVGHRLLSADGERLAAVMSLGADAVLSHVSAAIAWELVALRHVMWHVAVPHSSGGITGAHDVRPRRTRRLLDDDRTELRGVPITTVERTLLDMAGERGGRYVREMVHEAELRGLLDVAAVLATIERNPGRRGTKLLRKALGGVASTPGTERFARMFGRLCLHHGLPTPRLNVILDIGGRPTECDAVFDAARVIVELDGRQVHDTDQRFYADRRRDSAAAAAGWLVVRLTWDRVTREATQVAAELQAILALRSGGVGPSSPA